MRCFVTTKWSVEKLISKISRNQNFYIEVEFEGTLSWYLFNLENKSTDMCIAQ